ncbi:hypothetical protein GVAV_001330 [Gurleya vavrai]
MIIKNYFDNENISKIHNLIYFFNIIYFTNLNKTSIKENLNILKLLIPFYEKKRKIEKFLKLFLVTYNGYIALKKAAAEKLVHEEKNEKDESDSQKHSAELCNSQEQESAANAGKIV